MRHHARANNTAGLARRLVSVAMGVVGLLLVGAGVALPASTAANAATNATCSTASPGSGTYAQTLCWLDMSGYNASEATSAAGQSMSVALPGGSTLNFVVKASGGGISPVAFPTWGGAYLGNPATGAYTGVGGKPALYQTTSSTTTTLTINGANVTSPSGQPVRSFALVGADAESSDTNESVTWTSSNSIYSLTASSSGNGLGNSCGGGFSGVGSTRVVCSGRTTGQKTGTAILASDHPSSFSQQMVGGGRQAVAFGVLITKIELKKVVNSRFTGDDFRISATSPDGAYDFRASTGATGTTATTGVQTAIAATDGDAFTLSEQMLAGTLGNYNASWSCTRNGKSEAGLPAGTAPGYSASVSLAPGDLVACTITNTKKNTGVSLVKRVGSVTDVNGNGLTDAGDTIEYSFDLTNTGDVALTDPTVNDPKIGSVTCPAGDVAPGATVTCTADSPYTVTAEDESHGAVDNTATASATPRGTTDSVTSNRSSTSTPVTAADPSLSLTKQATPGDAASYTVGRQITYTFVVTNTGNTPIADVTVEEDTFSGSGPLSAIDCPADTTLQPNKTMTCTATYTLTQADVDAGRLTNSAHATGVPAGSGDAIRSNTASAEIPGDPQPAIGLEKSVSPATVSRTGDTVTYTFHVTNTGNVTLRDAAISETSFSGTGPAPDITCPSGALAPGESVDCTATYTVTQADVDAGRIDNTATATATPPAGATAPVSDPSSAEVTIPSSPGLAMEKTADHDVVGEVGMVVTYRFAVTNTGNVSIHDVSIDEGGFSGSGEMSDISCPSTSLAGGESMTCTATYTVTQADLDAGELSNSATASGTPIGQTDPISSAPSIVRIPAERTPSLSLEKSVDPDIAAAGDTIWYRFAITNTGNVTISDPMVSETAFSGSGALSEISCPSGPLAPGDRVDCTATYSVTADDGGAGAITNTAIASAQPPAGMERPSSNESSATVRILRPGISVAKSADRDDLVVGESITYSFRVTNTGEVTLTDVTLTEGEFTGSGRLSGISCPGETASLAPGEELVCTATYTVTQADVDRGELTNSATAAGSPPNGQPAVRSEPSRVRIPQDAQPGLSIVKSADRTDLVVGETITYSFVITNTGNVTLTNAGVSDGDFTGSGTMSDVSCPAEAASLAPGSQITCRATYEVAQADVDRGNLHNSATATGTPPGGGDPVSSEPSAVELTQEPYPGIALQKWSDTAQISRDGERIVYSFTMTNTGNVTLRDVTVTEGAFTGAGVLTDIACPDGAAVLVPGDAVTCTAAYEVTQADLDRGGKLTNTATARGTAPGGDAVDSEPSTTSVPVTQDPGLSIVKSADRSDLVAGETVTYSFAITNTGNVTLNDARVEEGEFTGSGALSAITCPDGAASLAPGEQVTCTATYDVTQADADRGSLRNTATALGELPGGDAVRSEPSTVDVPREPAPGLSLDKVADLATVSQAGQKITYSFVITNTGNVSLTDVRVEEGEFTGTGTLSAVTCPAEAASLGPGQSVTCTATYTVTDGDLSGEALQNSAVAVGTGSDGATVTSESSTATAGTVRIPETPASPEPPGTPEASASPEAPTLPDTGSEPSPWLFVIGSALIGFGAVVVGRRAGRQPTGMGDGRR